MKALLAAAVVALALALPTAASAYISPTTVITVNSTLDNANLCAIVSGKSTGPCTLRGAVLTANTIAPTDQVVNIKVPAGTFGLTLGPLAVSSTNNIVQIFGDTSGTTKVDGSQNAAPSSVFVINSATTIARMTITGGTGNGADAGNGGGIYVNGALDLTSVVIKNNIACSAFTGPFCTGTLGEGGGVFMHGSATYAVTMKSVSVKSNTARFGGGVANEATSDDSLLVSSSHLDNNIACDTLSNGVCIGDGKGGGIYNHAEAVSVYGSTIDGNTAGSPADESGEGGGIWNGNDTVHVSNSKISGNVAGDKGGGTWDGEQGQAAISILNSKVAKNIAGTKGGGMQEDYIAHVDHTVISGNTAGGTFACTINGGTTTCEQTVGPIVDNCATLYPSATMCHSSSGVGGGINSSSEYPEISNSVVKKNTAVTISIASGCLGGLGGGIATTFIFGATSSSIAGNTAQCGGGIFNSGGSVGLSKTTVTSNTALEDGGGIWTVGSGQVTLSSTSVTDNTASAQTGGVRDFATGDVVLGSGTTLSGNSSPGGCRNLTFPCR